MFGGEVIYSNSDYPWVVLVLSQLGTIYFKVCSGSVIAPYWILTAAHCLVEEGKPMPANVITIYVYRNLKNYNPYHVHSVYIHSKFGFKKNEDGNDLGLIRTKEPVEVSVGTMRRKTEYPNNTCTILGFGLQSETTSNNRSPLLSKLMVNLLPQEACKNMGSSASRILCLLAVNGVGPCSGDSGSPMICDNQIVGVCSRGLFDTKDVRCGTFSSAIILYEFLDIDWIEGVMQSNPSAGDILNVGIVVVVLPVLSLLVEI